MTRIENLLVVGAGAMGSQIAMLGALGGYDVSLVDVRQEAVDEAERTLRSRLQGSIDKGRMEQSAFDEAFARLTFSVDLPKAAAAADLVIEAIVEILEPKIALFGQISRYARPETIYATNSSSIVGSLIAASTDRPALFCNMHFFNPPLVMECVEIVAGPSAATETIEAATEVATRMGRKPVVLEKEIPGFVANRIVSAIFKEALALRDGGYASIDAIDEICRTALRHPMGPFELLDLAGLDVNLQMQESFYKQSGDPADLPPDSIRALVSENRLGRKTGRGFYDYSGAQKEQAG